MDTKCCAPGWRAGGYGNGAGLSALAIILPTVQDIINHEMARLRLAWAEKAVNRPFSMRTSLKLDHALLWAEALGVRRG